VSVSLHKRLLLVAAAVLAGFLLTVGAVLDNAFRSGAEQAQHDRLRGAVFTILAAVDVSDSSVTVPGSLPNPRLALPESGLYAWLMDSKGRTVWRSRSALGQPVPKAQPLPPGDTRFAHADTGDRFTLGYGVAWEVPDEPVRRFTVVVAESPNAYFDQIAAFRRSLWGWLGAGALLLLIAQWAALRWTLSPLRQVTRELADVERGRRDALSETYPSEITRLTHNLNTLIHAERDRSRRYRESLDNLAHSLKTPLAVLRGALRSRRSEELEAAADQIQRIDRSIDYHVRRGAAAGRSRMAAGIPLQPVTQRLVRALERAYGEKNVSCTIAVDETLRFAGEEDDLMELLGNVLDNAWKWCRSSIRVEGRKSAHGNAAGAALRIVVSDDGPGIPEPVRDRVTARGMRLDQQVPGEGIGLSVVRELVEAYAGRLSIEAADGGGTRIVMDLPAAVAS
jgi:two-component system sensor histidine kinase PhoQ